MAGRRLTKKTKKQSKGDRRISPRRSPKKKGVSHRCMCNGNDDGVLFFCMVWFLLRLYSQTSRCQWCCSISVHCHETQQRDERETICGVWWSYLWSMPKWRNSVAITGASFRRNQGEVCKKNPIGYCSGTAEMMRRMYKVSWNGAWVWEREKKSVLVHPQSHNTIQ